MTRWLGEGWGLTLGPLGIRTFSNRFGWGVTVWVGKLSGDLSWDR